MSIDEAEPFLLYLLDDFLSFVGAVHSGLILSVMKSNILLSLRLTNNMHHISLHGLMVHDPPPLCLCPVHSS